MKKSLKLAVLSACAVLGALAATSCATPFPLGCLYTDVTMPGSWPEPVWGSRLAANNSLPI